MKLSLKEKLNQKLKPCAGYTAGQIKKLLCPSQSSIADYLLMDAIAAGYLRPINPIDGVNPSYRLNL